MNSAFVFIKPHANTDAVRHLVSDELHKRGFKITKEGELTGKEIDEKRLIDTHYLSIASKATLLEPKQLNVPANKFQEKFGVSWQSALDSGAAVNAMNATKILGVDADQLDKLWAACKKNGDLIKFGGGFYCGKLDNKGKPLYVFNGFFMKMRAKFCVGSIHYYVIDWDSSKCSWEDFRGAVLGATDPADAAAGSLRSQIYKNWQSLGLAGQPNVGDNGVHASASPFEALAEKANWLGVAPLSDPFGRTLFAQAGLSLETIRLWAQDPQVVYGVGGAPVRSSLFDALEDTDVNECLARCYMINATVPNHNGHKTAAAVSAAAHDPVHIVSFFGILTIGAAFGYLLGRRS